MILGDLECLWHPRHGVPTASWRPGDARTRFSVPDMLLDGLVGAIAHVRPSPGSRIFDVTVDLRSGHRVTCCVPMETRW